MAALSRLVLVACATLVAVAVAAAAALRPFRKTGKRRRRRPHGVGQDRGGLDMADLGDVARLAGADHHLAVFTVGEPDGTVRASVVNAGVIDDPVDGAPGVAAVVGGGTRKLALLRRIGRATLIFKNGGDWAAVAGPVRLIGPDDGADLGLDVPQTIRSVFRAAGGRHEDWNEFDRVMAQDRRCAVFVRAQRISANAG
jgi:hypothetical protein